MDSAKIHAKQFRTKLRGYNCAEVDDFLDNMATEFDRMTAEVTELKASVTAAQEQQGELPVQGLLQRGLLLPQELRELVFERA